MSVSTAVVMAAGGSGRRMGGVRKQYVELAGEPVLARSIRPFLDVDGVRWVIVVLPEDDAEDPPRWLTELDPRVRTVAGGAERSDSVRAGVEAVPQEADVILVHDAARPLVTPDVIGRAIEVAATGAGAVVAVPVSDTIKVVDPEGTVLETPDRAGLWKAQTPQAFPRSVLAEAHARAAEEGAAATDDAALVERFGGTVVVVEGDASNLKITTEADLVLARALIRERE